MSLENVIIYILLPAIGYVYLRVARIEKKLTTLCVKLDDCLDLQSSSDTDHLVKL